MRHISFMKIWYHIATPQARLSGKLGADTVGDLKRSATVILTLFLFGAFSLCSPSPPVLLLFTCMWVMQLLALYWNRRGHSLIALYCCLGGIQVPLHGLFLVLYFMSGTGIVGVFYLSVFYLASGVFASLLPHNRVLSILLCENFVFYSGCLIFSSLSGIFTYPHLMIGWCCLFVAIVALFYRSRARTHDHNDDASETGYQKARADRLVGRVRELRRRTQKE